MLKRIFIFFCIGIIILNFSACGGQKKTRYEAEFLVLFNTVTKIVAYADTKEEFTEYSKFIYNSLKEYHELYDIYNNYEGINNIKTINDNAGIKPVKVDGKIIDLLNFSKNEYELSDGRINIAFGSVLKIWHDYREEGIDNFEDAKLPPLDKLKIASKHTDINQIIINEQDSTVYLNDPYMSLDVGAVGKGFATEQVSLAAIEKGFVSGIISVGGNVRTIGKKGDNNKPWNVGIQNPDNKDDSNVLYTLNLEDCSLVTSGNYERYYTVDGKRYHHIIDPQTLFPAEYFVAVSVVCKDSGRADALSTAIFNMTYENGKSLIESFPDTEAIWVMNDGTVKFSDGFERLIKR